MNEKPPGDVVTQDEYVAQAKSAEPLEAAGRHQPGAINIVENPLMVCIPPIPLRTLRGMRANQV